MSQVFAADSVNGGSVALPTSGATQVLVGNFLNPPFGNAKVIVSAVVLAQVGTGAGSVQVQLIRNPSKENLSIGYTNYVVTAGSSGEYAVPIQVADTIPDGRGVQYAIQVTQYGASTAGNVYYANITAILISG